MVTRDYYYPDLGCLVDLLQSGVEKKAGMGSQGSDPQP